MQTCEASIHSRLYSAVNSMPQKVAVPARYAEATNKANRYPYVECPFEGAILQPYVHDCVVHVREGKNTHQFAVFFKRHCRLKVNTLLSVGRVSEERMVFRGNVLVMRLGIINPRNVVNMRGRDTMLSDWMISKYVSFFVIKF
jgi:hypothetical protein